MDTGFSRPTSVPEMLDRMASFVSPEGAQAALDYRADPSDVFVVTPAKCGTTWMQQIVHGLRTRGSMDFDNINHVIPWLQMAHDEGIDLDDEQVARPHVFKTHSALDDVPDGGRYIVVVRDPQDALLSQYRFAEGSFFEPGSVDLDTFARDFYLPRRAIFNHVLAAWPRRADPDVLLLCYENMKADLPGAVERVARFLGLGTDPDLLEVVTRQSDIGFMKLHEEKFDDQGPFNIFRHRMRLPPVQSLSKVVSGRVGSAAGIVSVEVRELLADAWTTEVTPHTGLASYGDLRLLAKGS